MAAMRKCYSDL